MEYRYIGKTGLKVSAISIGTMVYGSDECDEKSAIDIVDKALDYGVNFFDTADYYSKGLSEEIVGRAFKQKRKSVILSTKVGLRMGDGPNEMGLSRGHIFNAVEDSLRRLQTDYIDLYYVHAVDYKTPFEVTLRALDDLVRQGKVRYIGCTNFRAWQLCKARSVSELHNLERFEVIQSPYNLLTRDIELELLHCCAAEEIGVVAYNPLAAGMLTGEHDMNKPPAEGTRFASKRKGFSSATIGEVYRDLFWNDLNFKAVSRLKQIAEDHGRNIIQFALAWILNNKTITSVVCGVTSIDQLTLDLDAIGLKLSEEELSICDEIWQKYFRPPGYFYARTAINQE